MENVQTCGRRMKEFGPWERKEGLDKWEQRGPDLCCSFCGSLHPDKVLEIAKEVIEGKDTTSVFHMSDKPYKLYLDRVEVKNAGEGGIKFYTPHIPDTDADEWLKVVNQAIKICHERIYKRHAGPQESY